VTTNFTPASVTNRLLARCFFRNTKGRKALDVKSGLQGGLSEA